MTRRPRQTVDLESPFDIAELFFSTTDRTGKIRSGNEVFTRVAKYSLEDMLGQPHSLIRHPDMPRAVFQLLWDTIQAGRPIAAYVKNLASDGSYYWVLATVVPIPGTDQYLSVRLKPSSDVFDVVGEVYRELRDIELEHEAAGDRPGGLAASIEALPGILDRLGFFSYDAFMHAVVPLEMQCRDDAMGEVERVNAALALTSGTTIGDTFRRCLEIRTLLDRQFAKLDEFISLSGRLDTKSAYVSGLAFNIRLVSLNAMAGSGRLSDEGAGLRVISRSIGSLAEQGERLVEEIAEHNADASARLKEAAFLMGLARLQLEMAIDFLAELLRAEHDGTHVEEREAMAREGVHALLAALAATTGRLFATYGAVTSGLIPVLGSIERLDRLVRMLEITHVTGRVEASQVGSSGTFLDFFAQVGNQVEHARAELLDYADAVRTTQEQIEALAARRDQIVLGIESLVGRTAA